ncbi:MAG TPA: hypothetical protein VNO70_21630 [Blastocatellia bacterium]|nr:hypothetical protein [Blastocatellia bacterium]
MPSLYTLNERLHLIDRLMQSTCDLADIRLQELGNTQTRQEALQKTEDTYRMLQDLCMVTRQLIKHLQDDMKMPELQKGKATQA